MRRTGTERARGGFLAGVLLVLASLVLAAVMAIAPLEQSTQREVAAAGLASDGLALAASAADEALHRFGHAANTPGSTLFESMRRGGEGLRGAGRGRWAPGPVEIPEATALARTMSSGTVKHEIASLRVTVEVQNRSPDPTLEEVTGQVKAEVTVQSSLGSRTVERSIARVQGFRLARLGLPWPFSDLGIFVHRAAGLLGDAPRLERRIATALDRLAAGRAPRSADLRRRLAAVRAFLRSRDAAGSWQRSSFYLSMREDRVQDLARMSLATAARDLAARWTSVQPVSGTVDDAALEPAIACAEELERTVKDVLRRWRQVPHRAPEHRRAFDPAIRGLIADHSASAWYALPSLAAFEALLPSEGRPARTGVVLLTGDAGLRTLTTSNLRGGRDAAGRLVVVVPGRVRVADLSARGDAGRGLYTIIATGPVELAGDVEANIVALDGLRVLPGTSIRGNVFVEGGDIELGERASLERDGATRQLEPGSQPTPQMFHLALDPRRITASVDGAP